MAYCRNCGKEIDESAKFCSYCGTATDVNANTNKSFNLGEKFQEFNNTKDHTEEFEAEDIENNKIIALFAYFGLLILIPIFATPNSRYAKFHVSQGINLIVVSLAYSAISSALVAAFSWLPVVCTLIDISVSLAGLLIVVLVVLGIYNAVNGKAKELPIIGSWKIYNY